MKRFCMILAFGAWRTYNRCMQETDSLHSCWNSSKTSDLWDHCSTTRVALWPTSFFFNLHPKRITSHPAIPLHRITSHQMTSHHMRAHHTTWHYITWHDTTRKITSHDMTSRNQPQYLTSRHLTTNHITSPQLAASHMTSHTTSQHITSPPPTHYGNTTSHHQNATTKRNGCRLVHTKTSV